MGERRSRSLLLLEELVRLSLRGAKGAGLLSNRHTPCAVAGHAMPAGSGERLWNFVAATAHGVCLLHSGAGPPYSRVMNSSRFISTRATARQASLGSVWRFRSR